MIRRNCSLKGVENGGQTLRPDISYIDSDGRLNVIEITVPYGQITDGKSSLTKAAEVKFEKYRELMNTAEGTLKGKVNYYVFVVSSLGAIPEESVKSFMNFMKASTKAKQNTVYKALRHICYQTMKASRFIYNNAFPNKGS